MTWVLISKTSTLNIWQSSEWQLSLSENCVASAPLKEGGLLAENELYSGASGFCCGNGECDPCKEIRTGSLSDCSCKCPLSSSVSLVMLRAHGCHFVALFDSYWPSLTLILYLENYTFLCFASSKGRSFTWEFFLCSLGDLCGEQADLTPRNVDVSAVEIKTCFSRMRGTCPSKLSGSCLAKSSFSLWFGLVLHCSVLFFFFSSKHL